MWPLLGMVCKCPQEKCLAQNFHEFLSAAEMAEFFKLCGFRQAEKNFFTSFLFECSIWISTSTFSMIAPFESFPFYTVKILKLLRGFMPSCRWPSAQWHCFSRSELPGRTQSFSFPTFFFSFYIMARTFNMSVTLLTNFNNTVHYSRSVILQIPRMHSSCVSDTLHSLSNQPQNPLFCLLL